MYVKCPQGRAEPIYTAGGFCRDIWPALREWRPRGAPHQSSQPLAVFRGIDRLFEEIGAFLRHVAAPQ